MNITSFSVAPKYALGTLTVVLPTTITPDRLDQVSEIIDHSLTSEGIGRFAWLQQGRRQEELVFHVFGERAALLVRAELDRLGYDRRALVITDFPDDLSQ